MPVLAIGQWIIHVVSLQFLFHFVNWHEVGSGLDQIFPKDDQWRLNVMVMVLEIVLEQVTGGVVGVIILNILGVKRLYYGLLI